METSMDDSFRARVDKIFGSLTSSSSQSPSPSPSSSSSQSQPSSSLQSALWSLTDDEVERKQWKRDAADGGPDRDEIPCSSSFDELKKDRRRDFRRELRDDLDELNDVDDGEEMERSRRGGADGLDEWEIRSSIGLDTTLDNEEEEDEYDKVASGRENASERLYMNNVTDQGSYLDFNTVLNKDPRANHLAAKIRLQEDDAEARKQTYGHDSDTREKELHIKSSGEDSHQLRSILKRKDKSSDLRPQKRVRFDPSCRIACEEEASETIENVLMDTSSVNVGVSNDGSMIGQAASAVPDYLRNPSKYTCYSFDSTSEVDEKSNSQAFMEFLKLVKSSKSMELGSDLENASTNLPKSVTFVPRKKLDVQAANDSSKVRQAEEDDGDRSIHNKGLPVGIAVGESHESEVDTMEDEKLETDAIDRSFSFKKASRRYRTKPSSDDHDH